MSARLRGLALAVAIAACSLGGALTTNASAAIQPPSVLTGPANDITAVDGSALAEDGTGGVLYSKLVDGVSHLFVVPVDLGRYGSPIEVDPDDADGANEPAIAAGLGGRLMVVWVEAYGVSSSGITQYALDSAELGPGAASFSAPIMVDSAVGEPYTADISGVDPSLAMQPDGQAYVVYRVVTDQCSEYDTQNSLNGACGTGAYTNASDEVIDVRAAESTGGAWSGVGTLNAYQDLAMRAPTADNAPQIATSTDGNGSAVAVWQEVDASGYARIFARWIYGTTLGNAIQLSPSTLDGQPVDVDADAPSVALAIGGTAAFRLAGGAGSPLSAPQIMACAVPGTAGIAPYLSDFASGSTVGEPQIVANVNGGTAVAAQAGGALDWSPSYSAGAQVIASGAGERAYASSDPSGGGSAVWTGATEDAAPYVGVRESFAGGQLQSAQLTGDVLGPISDLQLGDGDSGDALVAFMQGEVGDVEVVADYLKAPPQSFTLSAPGAWRQRVAGARVSWLPAPDDAAVSYALYVDGRLRYSNITGPAATDAGTGTGAVELAPISGDANTVSKQLGALGLDTGKHRVQVIALDADGQQTASNVATLKIDHTPPLVRLRLIDRRRGVRVTVSDPNSGVKAASTVIRFGDGKRIRRRANVSHRYRHGGTYKITAQVQDHAGNRTTVHLRVKVR